MSHSPDSDMFNTCWHTLAAFTAGVKYSTVQTDDSAAEPNFDSLSSNADELLPFGPLPSEDDVEFENFMPGFQHYLPRRDKRQAPVSTVHTSAKIMDFAYILNVVILHALNEYACSKVFTHDPCSISKWIGVIHACVSSYC